MKNKLYLFLLIYYSQNVLAVSLTEKLRIYGVIKPNKISTSISLGNGLVHKLFSSIGDKVTAGNPLLEILERESVRSYRSTISGYIAKVHITQGAAVSPGMPLVTVVDPKKKFMEISLSPDDAKKIRQGLVVKSITGSSIGNIDKISPIIDPETGAVVSILKLNEESPYRIGEVIPIDLILGNRDCDKVVLLSEVGGSKREYEIQFISDNNVCLKKK